MHSRPRSPISPSRPKSQSGNGTAESPDSSTVTTVKEYEFEPAARLPEVPGTSDYKALGAKRVVKFKVGRTMRNRVENAKRPGPA